MVLVNYMALDRVVYSDRNNYFLYKSFNFAMVIRTGQSTSYDTISFSYVLLNSLMELSFCLKPDVPLIVATLIILNLPVPQQSKIILRLFGYH